MSCAGIIDGCFTYIYMYIYIHIMHACIFVVSTCIQAFVEYMYICMYVYNRSMLEYR